jgi:hypothetical protein
MVIIAVGCPFDESAGMSIIGIVGLCPNDNAAVGSYHLVGFFVSVPVEIQGNGRIGEYLKVNLPIQVSGAN